MSNRNIRIRTTPGGEDKYVKVKIDQDFDNLDILSLRISQADTYKSFCSDYGVIVGRAIANGGIGLPNAKVSIFIPLTAEDEENELISELYPFKDVYNYTGPDGKRYNLLPSYNSTGDECYTPVGSIPSKMEMLDNDVLLEIHEKYYKYTTTTNEAGDYMLFGVPVGEHILHIDVDISDMGFLSQKPYDLIRDGASEALFQSPSKFNGEGDLDSLFQVKSYNVGVNVIPFWGDTENCEIGITRVDYNFPTRIESYAYFLGSIFGDDGKNAIKQNCKVKKKTGQLCEAMTASGTIEMIRFTESDTIESYNIKGGRVIDGDGTWAYQIPLNLDYKVTDEFGNIVASKKRGVGIATRSKVRFRISMDVAGDVRNKRLKAKYLVPHNPTKDGSDDYTFDENTNPDHFREIEINNVYTVRNFISKFTSTLSDRGHLGIKNVDDCDKTPFPFNKYDSDYGVKGVGFSLTCSIRTFSVNLLTFLNFLVNTINGLIAIVGGKRIKCRPAECNGQNFYPGCKGKGVPNDDNLGGVTKEALVSCRQTEIAENQGILEYDFYNDWVNGTLYFPIFKYKVKRNGKERFCDYDGEDTAKWTRTSGGFYYGNANTYVATSCINTEVGDTKKNAESKIELGWKGLIKKENNDFYYAPHAKKLNSEEEIPLLATDITNLGPIREYSTLGGNNYHTISFLPSTSYNDIPNGVLTDENGYTLESGIDNFIVKIKCAGITTNKKYCKNIDKICEVGMGGDEAILKDDGDIKTAANGILNDEDIDFLNLRTRLICNELKEEIIYPTDDNPIPIIGNIYDPIAPSNLQRDIYHEAYEKFRGYQETASRGHKPRKYKGNNYDIDLPLNNSLYFYFGLINGKTSLDKFRNLYLTSCPPAILSSIRINTVEIVNNDTLGGSDGSIQIEVIGGSGEYQYTWTYLNDNSQLSSANESVLGLLAGTYRVTVFDTVNNVTSTKDITITEPIPLSITIESIDLTGSTSDDGVLNVSIFGGDGPYDLEIIAPSASNIGNSITDISSSISFGQFKDLPKGDYTIQVTDNNGGTSTATATLTAPIPFITETPTFTSTSCGENNGQLTIKVPTGGDGKYRYELVKPTGDPESSEITSDTTFSSLEPGDYAVILFDGSGQSSVYNITINESVDITNIVVIPSSTSGSGPHQIKVTVEGGNINGTGDITFKLFDSTSTLIATKTGNIASSLIPSTTVTFNSADGVDVGTYKIQISDEIGCIKLKNNIVVS